VRQLFAKNQTAQYRKLAENLNRQAAARETLSEYQPQK